MQDTIEKVAPEKDFEGFSKLSDEEVRQAALDWVNTLRTEYGFDALDALPTGIVGHPGACALASGLIALTTPGSPPIKDSGHRYAQSNGEFPEGMGVRFTFVRDGVEQTRFAPDAVGEFIRRFDRGDYPDLVNAPLTAIISLT